LEFAGYLNVEAFMDSTTALAAMQAHCPDIIILDLNMPKPNGYEVLAQLRAEGSFAQTIPILVFTADSSPDARARALDLGASDFLTKPGEAEEILLRVKNFLQLRRAHVDLINMNSELEAKVKQRTAELSASRREALETLAKLAEFRDYDTGQHTTRVGDLSASIALQLGNDSDFVEALRLAAPLHDLGKIALPEAILFKPGKLDHDETQTMRQHTLVGGQVFSGVESPLMILCREIALHHHERWDGTGYPDEISGESIPLAARIVAVADVYDALVQERPYKQAWSHEDALAEITAQSGKQFDPEIVEAFVALMASIEQSQAA
jgi:putative two-component system response regulator